MHSRLIASTGLTPVEFAAGIIVKVALGFLYGYIYLHYYNGDDTWKQFHESVAQTKVLLNDPGLFFRDEFTPLHSIRIGKNWMDVLRLYADDLQYVLVVKSMALVNLVTRGNYYLNMVVFNLVIFRGHVWLFRTMTAYFPGNRRWFFGAVFLFLPAVFWTSGYRIDGWLFFFLAFFLFHLTTGSKRGIIRYIYLGAGLVGMLISRPEVAALAVVAAAGYVVSKKTGRPFRSFAIVYGFAALVFFGSEWLMPQKGLVSSTVAKQQAFLQLEGTRFDLDKLSPDVAGFIKVLPEAVANTFFRPLPWEAEGMLQLMAAGEIVVFWLMLAVSIYKRDGGWKQRLSHPVILMMMALGVSVYVAVGYLVPFPGAIIRYKACAEILLVCVMAAVACVPKKHIINKNI